MEFIFDMDRIMKLKSSLSALALTVSGLFAVASPSFAAEKLSVAATPVPAGEILEFMKPQLAELGVDLESYTFTDYIQPNQQVAEKQIDMNCFQHRPHLNTYNTQEKQNLVQQGFMYVLPMAAYSNKIKSIDELKDKASVAIPSDTTNGARALLLLQKAGLIRLKDPENLFATSRDIVENPKNLKFIELEAASVPRALADVDLAVINTNYALDIKLNPKEDAVILEDVDSPYALVCASREDNKDSELIKKVNQVWQSEATVKFIEEKYQGSVIPVKG